MPVPSPRNKILPVRGNKATLQSNLASLADGEICYALDENSFYVKESGALVEAGGASAKAWVNFNGQTTITIRDSYNVASLTDHGTGQYSANFTTSMPNADYATVGTLNDSGSGSVVVLHWEAATTSAIRVNCIRTGSGFTDPIVVGLVIFGD